LDGSAAIGSDYFAIGSSTGAGTFTSMVDSVNSTMTRDISVSNSGRGGLWRLFAIAGALVSGSTTLALTSSGSSTKGIAGWVMTGGTVGALDKPGTSATGTGTSMTTTATGVLTQAVELAFALYQFVGTPTFTEPAGWTNVFGTGNYLATTVTVNNVAICFKETAATTTLSPTATLGTSNAWASQCLTYTWTDTVVATPIPEIAMGLTVT
jgi:hypothetical protein